MKISPFSPQQGSGDFDFHKDRACKEPVGLKTKHISPQGSSQGHQNAEHDKVHHVCVTDFIHEKGAEKDKAVHRETHSAIHPLSWL